MSTLRVQVLKYEAYTPNQNYDSAIIEKHVYSIVGYFGPLGLGLAELLTVST